MQKISIYVILMLIISTIVALYSHAIYDAIYPEYDVPPKMSGNYEDGPRVTWKGTVCANCHFL